MFEFLLQRFVGDRHGMQARRDGIAFLKAAKSLYPIETVEYLALNIPLGAQHRGFLHCVYSDVGLNQCATKDALTAPSFDDVALALRQPLDWSELTGIPEGEGLLRLANGATRQRRLLSLPVRAIAGEQGLLFLVTSLANGDWHKQKDVLLREFQILGNYFHQHILRIYGHDAAKDMLISAQRARLPEMDGGRQDGVGSERHPGDQRANGSLPSQWRAREAQLHDHHPGGGEGRVPAVDLERPRRPRRLEQAQCCRSPARPPAAQCSRNAFEKLSSTGRMM